MDRRARWPAARVLVPLHATIFLISACTASSAPPSPSASGVTPSPSTAIGSGASPDPSATPGGGIGGSGGSGEMAFSDSHPFFADAWSIFATQAETQICSKPEADVEEMDLETATANTRAFLDDGAGAGAMDALDRSPDGRSIEKATTAAAAAMMDTNEAGALAALLAAARLEPDNPRHLVNAAGLMPAFGLSSEALAFLDAAEAMGTPEGAPFGIDQRAVHLNNQGRALLSLQRWDEADPLLREAIDLDATLSEASTNLSLALLCRGDRAEAMIYAKAGRYRKPMRFTEEDNVSTPNPADAFDLSVGVGSADALVPGLPLPATPEQGAALRQFYETLKQDIIQRTIDRSMRQVELQRAAASANKHQMTLTRINDIMLALSELTARDPELWPEVTARSDETFARFDEHWGPAGTVEQISDDCGGSGRSAGGGDYVGCMNAQCIPSTSAAHGAWLTSLGELDAAVRAWADEYHPIATAIAGHLSDTDMHELASMRIQEALDQAFLILVTRAEEFTIFEDTHLTLCVTAPDPPPPPDTRLGSAPAGSPCAVTTGAWSIKISFVTISVDCEDWSLEAETPGVLGVFAQISSKGGETTLFAGPQASLGVPPFEATTRGGFYLTASDTSGVRDFGYRVEPGNLSAERGPLEVTLVSAEAMDFSFVGITAYLPGF